MCLYLRCIFDVLSLLLLCLYSVCIVCISQNVSVSMRLTTFRAKNTSKYIQYRHIHTNTNMTYIPKYIHNTYKINQLLCCLYVPKNTYKYKHAGSLMSTSLTVVAMQRLALLWSSIRGKQIPPFRQRLSSISHIIFPGVCQHRRDGRLYNAMGGSG